MLLVLDENIVDIDYVNNINASHALENILAAGVDGNHLITSNLRTLKVLSSLPSLSARSKAYIDRQINRFAEYGAITKIIDVCYIVEGSLVTPYKDKGRNWHIPLLHFSRMDMLIQTTLLAENITDSRLYAHAAEHYKQKNKLNNIKISITNQGGGGSTTVDEVRQRVAKPSGFCICILDSDKYCPTSDYGATFQSCISVITGDEWWFDILTTQKRELENEIPQKFIEEALQSNSEFCAELNKYIKHLEVLATLDENVANYFDFKDGVTMKWILQLPGNAKEFWLESIKSLIEHAECKSKCMASSACKNTTTKTPCNSLLLQGIAPTLLAIVLNWIDQQNPNYISKFLCNDKDASWINLGKKVLQFGIGSHVVRI